MSVRRSCSCMLSPHCGVYSTAALIKGFSKQIESDDCFLQLTTIAGIAFCPFTLQASKTTSSSSILIIAHSQRLIATSHSLMRFDRRQVSPSGGSCSSSSSSSGNGLRASSNFATYRLSVGQQRLLGEPSTTSFLATNGLFISIQYTHGRLYVDIDSGYIRCSVAPVCLRPIIASLLWPRRPSAGRDGIARISSPFSVSG